MKVKLENDYKRFYTLEDIEHAKAVIASEKDDEETAKGWAEYAINEALSDRYDCIVEILKADARTAKNCRIWNAYGDDTGNMDVWIEATAETHKGFIKVGAYLSDIWQTGAVDYEDHMYVRYFKEAK